jgi:hypothetical protein
MLPKIETCSKCRYYKPWCKLRYRSGGGVPPWDLFSSYKYKEWWLTWKLVKLVLFLVLFVFTQIAIGSELWALGIASGSLWVVYYMWCRTFYVPACVPWERSATEQYLAS